MRFGLLVLCGIVYGLVAGWLFRRFANSAELRRAGNRIIAHVLEFRLFIDEPWLIFRAQRDLVKANFALLRAVAIPLLISGALLAVAYGPLESRLGKSPLQAGDVTVAKVSSMSADLDLIAPFGVVVETPALRVSSEGATIWRIRAMSPVNGDFRTVPQRLPVEIGYRPATYFGVSWLWPFGLMSTIASATVIGRK